MSEHARHFEPNPNQPDRCPSMDPHDSGLQCTRPIHDNDQCHSGGIAWRKGTPRVMTEWEQAVAEVQRRLYEVFGKVCDKPCPHVGCQAQHITADVWLDPRYKRITPPGQTPADTATDTGQEET